MDRAMDGYKISRNSSMNARQLIVWKPGAAMRGVIFSASVGLTLLLGLVHYLTGLAYDFHVFFSLPVLLAAWFLGLRPALAGALLSTTVWFLADRSLGGDQPDFLPLLFNTATRLAIFTGEAWLLAHMRRALDRESRMAREDALTSLPNRREFYEQGRRALAQASRQKTPFTAVFIDLDKFKQVNDELGHEAGDALLICVAEEIRKHSRAGDIPGRLGGDEFALLFPGMDAAASKTYVEELRQRLLGAMRIHGWPVTFSIGVASHPQAPDDLDRLLAQADELMYEVKENGRDRILQKELRG